MTRHGPALLALSVLAIAGWTYNVNYDTRAALDRLEGLRGSIAEEREALQVLRVEWAYLNAPDRLARLLGDHKDRLALVALTPDALGHVAAVPYPRGLPVQPVPGPAPEALVAAAPQVEPPVVLALAEPAPGYDAAGAAATGAAAQETAGAELAARDAAGAGAADPLGSAEPPAAPEETAVAAAGLLSPQDKAGALGGDTGGLTMADAVALALAEAGVTDAKLSAPIITASAPVGMPMPRARPAVWGRQ